jgi:hypothetical protein
MLLTILRSGGTSIANVWEQKVRERFSGTKRAESEEAEINTVVIFINSIRLGEHKSYDAREAEKESIMY